MDAHRSPAVSRTGTALLDGLLGSGNEALWRAYVDRYRPILLRTLEGSGIPAQDAEDLVQVTLAEFARAYRAGQYERARGRLRSWLFGILRNQTRSWRRSRARTPEATVEPGGEALELEASDELEARWEREWQREVLRRTLAQVRSEVSGGQWEAFRLFVIEQRSAAQAAERLGTSAAWVYGAKRRVLERVRALRPMMADLESC